MSLPALSRPYWSGRIALEGDATIPATPYLHITRLSMESLTPGPGMGYDSFISRLTRLAGNGNIQEDGKLGRAAFTFELESYSLGQRNTGPSRAWTKVASDDLSRLSQYRAGPSLA